MFKIGVFGITLIRGLATMAKPRVFFDMSVGGVQVGRIIMEVNIVSIYCILWIINMKLPVYPKGIMITQFLHCLEDKIMYSVYRLNYNISQLCCFINS